MTLEIKTECSGHFKLEVRRADGTLRETLEFQNLITNGGLNRLAAAADIAYYCQVGSGSTAPTVNDSALVSRIAVVFYNGGSNGIQPSAPYYAWGITTYRFSEGTAAGILAEIGVGWATTGSLFSRALILDGNGDPTTITILANETLDVTYQLRVYPPLVDSTGLLTLRGTEHTVTGRACGVNVSGQWYAPSHTTGVHEGFFSGITAYNGEIGAITASAPAGTASTGSAVGVAYVTDSLQKDGTATFALAQGNFAGGITAFRANNFGCGSYQFGFSPAIMKTNVDTLTLTLRHSWARKTL